MHFLRVCPRLHTYWSVPIPMPVRAANLRTRCPGTAHLGRAQYEQARCSNRHGTHPCMPTSSLLHTTTKLDRLRLANHERLAASAAASVALRAVAAALRLSFTMSSPASTHGAQACNATQQRSSTCCYISSSTCSYISRVVTLRTPSHCPLGVRRSSPHMSSRLPASVAPDRALLRVRNIRRTLRHVFLHAAGGLQVRFVSHAALRQHCRRRDNEMTTKSQT